MTKLHLIAGITPRLQQRLEAAGVASVEALAQQEAASLTERINNPAEGRGTPAGPLTSPGQVDQLIRLAQALVGQPPGDAGNSGKAEPGDVAVDLGQVPEAIAVRPAAKPVAAKADPSRVERPHAQTTKAKPHITKSLAVKRAAAKPASTPSAPSAPATSPPEDSKPAAGAPPRAASAASAASAAGAAPAAKAESKAAEMPKYRDFQAYTEGRMGVEPLERKPSEDEEEVEGALKRHHYKPGDPVPRLVRRGVPHPRPFLLLFCSLIVVATRLLLMAVIVGTPIVLWPAFERGDTGPLISFLWVIVAFLISGLFYIVFAVRPRCRICTNHIFWSKRCMKNSKAHRVPGLGLAGSLALHALLFWWFRCMYCGTAVRLKFVADPERSK